MSLLVVGGRSKVQRRPVAEWFNSEAGIVVEVDEASGAVNVVLEYVSPREVTPDGDRSVLFKAATRVGDRLYLCTQTEVMVLRLPGFEREAYISLPCFNDVHHVAPDAAGNLLVAVTGLDMVVRVTPDGRILDEWSVIDTPTWSRFDRTVDYRKIPTTKPHAAHPNFVLERDGAVWATRFDQHDSINLADRSQTIPIECGFPHDGMLHDGRIYFTTVQGYVAIADPATRRVERTIDLTHVFQPEQPLGWCRGIKIVDDRYAIVGFSRLRFTKQQENVAWVKDQIKKLLKRNDAMRPLATRIACFDLRTEAPLWEVKLEEHGVNEVFSIL